MKKALTYVYLQLKRMARYAPFVFGITLLLCLCLALALAVIVGTDSNDEDKQKFTVGVVGDFSDSYLNLGISALKSMDSSRFTIEIAELEEPQAKEMLERGELMAYVVIPEGFVDDAMYGNIHKLQYVTRESGLDIAVLFKDEVLKMISCMLVESQNGIYSMQEIMWEKNSGSIMNHTYTVMAEYMALILNRSTALKQQVIGVADSISLGGYMFSGITVLLLLLCGIACCPLFTHRDRAMLMLLNANRCGPVFQIAGEFFAYFAMILVDMALLFGVLLIGAGDAIAIIPELAELTPQSIMELFVRFIPAILAIAALQFLLYELTDSVVSGMLLQLLCAVTLAYVSGCFYPINFFPAGIRALSAVTPSGIARGYLSSLISGDGQMWAAVALLGYAFVLLCGAGIARWRRIQRA